MVFYAWKTQRLVGAMCWYSEQGAKCGLKAGCASATGRAEEHLYHESDIAGTGPAGDLKMNSIQEGLLPGEETLVERDLPIVGTEEVAESWLLEEN